MKRILLMFMKNIFRVPGILIKLSRYSKNVEKFPEEERFEILKEIVGYANKGGNVKIEATGIENIPKEDGFIFFPNHQGLYDALALVEICPKPFSTLIL